MAGESADAVARRQREKAERLMRSATRYEQGAAGERATAEALRALPAGEWMVFHDVRWPGRRHANIDHIVVGPGGVFVIDSKHWSGRISLDGGVLRQNGYRRDPAVAGVTEAAAEISRLIRSVSPVRVAPVLCLVRDEDVVGSLRDVLVCGTETVATMLASRAAVLTPEQVRLIILDLDIVLRETAAVPRQVGPTGARPRPVRAPRPVSAPRRRRRVRIMRPLAGLAVMGMLALNPEILTSAAAEVADLVVDTEPGAEPKEPTREPAREPAKEPRRSQR